MTERGHTRPGADALDALSAEGLAAALDHLGGRDLLERARPRPLLAHCSLSAVTGGRRLAGAPTRVLDALRAALGPAGTLLMPAHTPSCSEPANWTNPPVSVVLWPTIRALATPYRPEATPSEHMGIVAETFRAEPATRRSAHPQVSFCAQGPAADALLSAHPLEDGLGEAGPLGALYRADARVLLLGCGFDRCTALHLAEHALDEPPRVREGAAVRGADGRRRWVAFDTLAYDSDDFARLGEAWERVEPAAVRRGRVGHADARLFALRAAVDFARGWLRAHRRA